MSNQPPIDPSVFAPIVEHHAKRAMKNITAIVRHQSAYPGEYDSPIESMLMECYVLHQFLGEAVCPTIDTHTAVVMVRDDEISSAKSPEEFVKRCILDASARMENNQDSRLSSIDYISKQHCIGKYRADFLICRVLVCDATDIAVCAVVECDGHAFHERTKKQAARDRSRDRYMQGLGVSVLRFTGSEIWGDPFKCVMELDSFLDRTAFKLSESRRGAL